MTGIDDIAGPEWSNPKKPLPKPSSPGKYILHHRRDDGMAWRHWSGPYENRTTAEQTMRIAQAKYPSYEFEITEK